MVQQSPSIRNEPPEKERDSQGNAVAWAICLIGALLRIAFFLHDKNLWLDEATASLSIVHRGFLGLCAPLEYSQMAPLGFLWAVKASVLAFGDHDLAFRVPSLLAGLAGVFFFYKLVKAVFPQGGLPALLALALFALNPALLSYTCQAKVYGLDALCSILLLLAANRALQSKRTADLALFGAVATVGCWFSFPSCFVLGAAGLVLMWDAARDRAWKRLATAAAATGAATMSFAAQYWFFARQPSGVMTEIWKNEWIRLIPRSVSDVRVDWTLLTQSLNDPFGFQWTALGLLILSLAGAELLLTRNRWGLLLMGPVVLGLIGSCVSKYPWLARFLLFLVPMGCVAAGFSLQMLKRFLGPKQFASAAFILVWLAVGPPARNAAARAEQPLTSEGFTNLMQVLNASRNGANTLFVDNQSTPVFLFYDRRHGYSQRFHVLGTEVYMDDNTAYRTRLKSLAGTGKKVWVVFPDHFIGWPTHLWSTLAILDSVGHRESSVEFFHSSAYLYQF